MGSFQNLIIYAVYIVLFTASHFVLSAPASAGNWKSIVSNTAGSTSLTVLIGISKTKLTSADERLFKINGRTEYFAGINTLKDC